MLKSNVSIFLPMFFEFLFSTMCAMGPCLRLNLCGVEINGPTILYLCYICRIWSIHPSSITILIRVLGEGAGSQLTLDERWGTSWTGWQFITGLTQTNQSRSHPHFGAIYRHQLTCKTTVLTTAPLCSPDRNLPTIFYLKIRHMRLTSFPLWL